MICTRCKVDKPINEFHKDKRSKTGHQSRCGPCIREVRGRHITPEHKRKRKNVNQLPTDGITLKDKLQWIIDSKTGKPCQHCGCQPHSSALDYHHLNESEKLFSLSQIRRFRTGEITLQSIKEEMKKCILLCANCHRMLHAGALTLNKQCHY